MPGDFLSERTVSRCLRAPWELLLAGERASCPRCLARRARPPRHRLGTLTLVLQNMLIVIVASPEGLECSLLHGAPLPLEVPSNWLRPGVPAESSAFCNCTTIL